MAIAPRLTERPARRLDGPALTLESVAIDGVDVRLPIVGPLVSVALIGGQRLLREAVASILMGEGELDVLGAFDSAADYLCAAQTPADVLLLDCEDGEDWQHALQALEQADESSRVMLLCAAIGEEAIRCAVDGRVSGVMLKDCELHEACDAIAYVATGRSIMPVGWQRVFDRARSKPLGLSPRQREILALIADGRGTADIASRLRLSPNTVKFHIRGLYGRLGVHNRVEAANRYAGGQGPCRVMRRSQ
jgi:DNA-binding NarL/FixJ family response regulator